MIGKKISHYSVTEKLGAGGLAGFFILGLAILGQAEGPWKQWSWGADASTRALYHPAWKIEFQNEVRFLGRNATYVYQEDRNQWMVTVSLNDQNPVSSWGVPDWGGSLIRTTKGPLKVVGKRLGHLTLSWAGCAQKISPMQLWTREQLGRVWLEDARRRWRASPSSSEELAEKIGVSDPEVADSFEDEQNVWVSIRFYNGEGLAGMRVCGCRQRNSGKAARVRGSDS